jgi:hypothetical protein
VLVIVAAQRAVHEGCELLLLVSWHLAAIEPRLDRLWRLVAAQLLNIGLKLGRPTPVVASDLTYLRRC